MLPFSRRKKAEEIELGDEDLEVLEDDVLDDAAIEIDVADLSPVVEAREPVRHRLPPVTPPPPKQSLRRLVIGSRHDRFEDDVADECLKSIAAATSRARLSDSFPASIVPPVGAGIIVPPSPRLPSFDDDADETIRRPALTSSSALPIARDSVPGVLATSPSSTPAPVFARTSSSSLPASTAVTASSVAPVSMSSTPGGVERDPTVILVRQPPRTAWIMAAAVLGAACALLGMHLVSRPADPARPVVLAAPPATSEATSETTKPAAPPPAAAPTPVAPPATVRFNDEQGVAVVAAAPAAATKPAVTTAAVTKTTPAAPAAPAKTATSTPAAKPTALGPKLPDGSVALGARAAEPTKAASAPASEPAPTPTHKKKLTPEQELAEAQLKASMK